MKKILLSSLAVFIVFLSSAQIKKGTVFIGGNIGFSHQTLKTDDSLYNSVSPGTSFIFTPSVGWAIKDNLVFGIALGYSYQKNTYYNNNPGYYNEQNNYSAGVFLRKYKTLGGGFSLFGETDLTLNYSTTPSAAGISGTQDTKSYGAGVSFYPGVAYKVSGHWQLETGLPGLAHITYNHTKETVHAPASESHVSGNTLNAGTTLGSYFQFSVGILYVI